MSKLKLHKPWDEVKEQLKEINAKLTDKDLVYTEGQEDELLERLSGIMKMGPRDVKALIESVSFNEGKAS
jgi:hypothetical protein